MQDKLRFHMPYAPQEKYNMEFILAGASAVSIGTANFFNPYAAEETVQGIEAYMREKKVARLTDLIGIVK